MKTTIDVVFADGLKYNIISSFPDRYKFKRNQFNSITPLSKTLDAERYFELGGWRINNIF